MTGDFLLGLACGVVACAAIGILGSLVGRFLGHADTYDPHCDEFTSPPPPDPAR